MGWQEEFGRSVFFYLTGLKECFALHGIATVSRIVAALDGHRSAIADRIPRRWLETYPSAECLERHPDLAFWNLDEVGEGVVRRAAQKRPISFAKAMLILLCLQEWLRAYGTERADPPELQIRLANAYIPFLGRYLERLDEDEHLSLLIGLSGEEGGEVAETTLNELVVGFPVTRRFAQDVLDALLMSRNISDTLKHKIQIRFYPNRTDVRDTVIRNDPGIVDAGIELMRVASDERPQY